MNTENLTEIELTDEQLEMVSGGTAHYNAHLQQEQREREEREERERLRHRHGHWGWFHHHRQWFWDR